MITILVGPYIIIFGFLDPQDTISFSVSWFAGASLPELLGCPISDGWESQEVGHRAKAARILVVDGSLIHCPKDRMHNHKHKDPTCWP